MKFAIRLAAMLFVASLGFFGLPSTALAEEVRDCTNGCTIATCNAQICTVWYCDGASGCKMMATYPNPRVKEKAMPDRGTILGATGEVAYAKVCPARKSCDLYELGVNEGINLGSFDNIDDIVEYRKSQID
jgi:hypothetical protein